MRILLSNHPYLFNKLQKFIRVFILLISENTIWQWWVVWGRVKSVSIASLQTLLMSFWEYMQSTTFVTSGYFQVSSVYCDYQKATLIEIKELCCCGWVTWDRNEGWLKALHLCSWWVSALGLMGHSWTASSSLSPAKTAIAHPNDCVDQEYFGVGMDPALMAAFYPHTCSSQIEKIMCSQRGETSEE